MTQAIECEDRLAHSGDQRLFLAQEQKVGENAGFTLEFERLRIPAVVAAVVGITEQAGIHQVGKRVRLHLGLTVEQDGRLVQRPAAMVADQHVRGHAGYRGPGRWWATGPTTENGSRAD